MSRASTFLRDIIIPYHEDYRNNEELVRQALKYPEHFAIESLFERSLSDESKRSGVGYDHTPTVGQDFNDVDNSDAKIGSVIKYIKTDKKTGRRYESYKIEISGFQNKKGSIRMAIYNQFKDCIDLFYIPTDRISSMTRICYGVNSGKLRIIMSWNPKKDSYNMYEEFRVKTFPELANAHG